MAAGAVQIVAGVLNPADSSLVGSVSNLRRYSAAQVLLTDVATICHKFDVTINDVALAAITDSFRAMLMQRGEHPQQNSLRTLVPVSVRSPTHRTNSTIAFRSCCPIFHRARGSRRTAAGGPQPTNEGQVRRATTSRIGVLFGDQLHPVRLDRLGGSAANTASPTRDRRIGD